MVAHGLVGPAGRAAEDVVHPIPGHADAPPHVPPVVGVDLLALGQRRFDALRRRQPREPLTGRFVEGVGAENDAPGAVDAVRRIPDLRDVLAGPGDAAVDVLVFPEAPVGLEGQLEEAAALRRRQGPHVPRGQVVAQADHQVGGHAVEAVVGPHRPHLAAGARAGHVHAGLAQADLVHRRPQLDRVAHVAHETVDDAVHAPRRLHHGRGLVGQLAPVHVLAPEVRAEQLGEGAHGLLDTGRGHAPAGVAGAVRPAVGERLVQVAVDAQKLAQPLVVVGVEPGVEGARVDRLGQQLGQKAARVGHVLAMADGPPAEGVVVVDPGVAVLVDEDLERDRELAAVAQQVGVAPGDPRRAGVEVEVGAVVELADLSRPQLVDHVAVPQGEAAPPGAVRGLQDGAAVARLAQLVGRGQPCDARADNDDVPRPGAGGAQGGLTGLRRFRQQTEGGGGGVHGGRPAGRADRAQQLAAGDARVHRCLYVLVSGRRHPAGGADGRGPPTG